MLHGAKSYATSAGGNQDTPKSLQEKLRHYYVRKYSHVTPVPWNQHFIVELNKMYTQVKVIPVPKGQRGTIQTDTSFEVEHQTIGEILNRSVSAQRSGTRILLEGDSGMGKSIMMRKLALDWAFETATDTEGSQRSVPFDLVLVIEGQSIHSSTFKEILESGELSRKMNDEIIQLLDDSSLQKRTLIIVDGFDEIQNGNENLLPLLSGAEFNRCTVLVTSRTNQAAALSRHFDEIYLIPGFQRSSMEEFIRKYSHQTDCQAEETLHTLLGDHYGSGTAVHNLTKNPMYLQYLCILLEDGQGQLPKTRTEIYQTLTQLVTEKNAQGLKSELEKCNQAFEELCKVAFLCVLENKMEFEEKDLPKQSEMVKLVLKFGFLTQKMSRSRLAPKKLFSFSHKSLLEYLAAKYIRKMEGKQRVHLLKDRRNNTTWNMVFVFLCGLLQGHDEELDKLYREVICKDLQNSLKQASTFASVSSKHWNYHLGLECLAESGIFDTFEELSPGLVPHCFELSWMYDCYYCVQGFEKAHTIVLPHKPDIVVFGPEFVPIHEYKYAIPHLLQTGTQHESLVLSNIVSVRGLTKIIQEFAPHCKKLAHVYIYMVPVLHSSRGLKEMNDGDIEGSLSNLVSLKSLVFQGPTTMFSSFGEADLIRKEVKFIVEKLLLLVPQMQTLVFFCIILEESAIELLVSRIKECRNLENLQLWNIRMEDTSLTRILETQINSTRVTSLGLHNCAKFTSEESRTKLLLTIGSILEKNKMKSLTLMDLDLQMKDISMFLDPFSKMISLKQFGYGGSVFSNENTTTIFGAIRSLTNLSVLNFRKLKLIDSDIRALAETTKCLATLSEFEMISCNVGGHKEFVELATNLKQNKHLGTVILEDCGITDADAEAVAQLFQISNLRILSLMGNSIGSSEESLNQIISGLSRCIYLQDLHLFLEAFTLEVGEKMACSMEIYNQELTTLRITTKPGLFFTKLDKLLSMFRDKIPSLNEIQFGMALPGSSMKPRKTDHEMWKLECTDWP